MKFDDWGYYAWKFKKEAIQRRLAIAMNLLLAVKAAGIEFDAVAVHGTSGTWLAPLLILEGYNVVMIRKNGEKAHGSLIEGPAGIDIKRIIILDDFICSGDTIRTICRKANKESMQVVALVMHDPDASHSGQFNSIPIFRGEL